MSLLLVCWDAERVDAQVELWTLPTPPTRRASPGWTTSRRAGMWVTGEQVAPPGAVGPIGPRP